ncbi:MAG: hypothetical protein GX046_02090 [Tissierellia bacterium]|nr:hypothetical protein [Tissierellia bacterium]
MTCWLSSAALCLARYRGWAPSTISWTASGWAKNPAGSGRPGKKRTKPANGEKLPPKHPGVVDRLVARLLEGRVFTCREESVLHQILAISVVRPSLELGLLGDPKDMTIAGDGSIYESGGSPHGKKICKCEERCDCKRRFSDDAYPIYELLNSWQIEPFIELNKRRGSKPSREKIDDRGVPVCTRGERMVYWGYSKKRNRIKWRCPLACGRVQECSCKDSCSSSSYGRVFYTKPDTDLRLFTKTVRGSKAWKEVYKRRTTTERSIKRKKIDYRMEHTRVRSKRRRLWLLTLGAINQHLDAWRAEFPISIAELLGLEDAA